MTTEHQTEFNSNQQHSKSLINIFLVGEGIHVLNPQVLDAIHEKRPTDLAELCRKRVEAGAQALAVNLGPGKQMQQHMEWVLETITSAAEVPIFLSSSVTGDEEILKKHGTRITINAVTADSDTLQQHMEVAKRFKTGLVVLLVKSGFVPTGVNDRIILASEVLETAVKADLPSSQLYLDPVLGCRPDPFAQTVSKGLPDLSTIAESLVLIKELSSDLKTIIGLSNGSVGLSGDKRSALHRRMLCFFAANGLDAAIINCLDKNLMHVAKNIDRNLFSQPAFQPQSILASAV